MDTEPEDLPQQPLAGLFSIVDRPHHEHPSGLIVYLPILELRQDCITPKGIPLKAAVFAVPEYDTISKKLRLNKFFQKGSRL